MPEDFAGSADTLMDDTRYGMEHGCAGYTFTVWRENDRAAAFYLRHGKNDVYDLCYPSGREQHAL